MAATNSQLVAMAKGAARKTGRSPPEQCLEFARGGACWQEVARLVGQLELRSSGGGEAGGVKLGQFGGSIANACPWLASLPSPMRTAAHVPS